MEPIRVWYQVNTLGPPPQQFLCRLQKINSCFGTSQMAPAVGLLACHEKGRGVVGIADSQTIVKDDCLPKAVT